MKDERKNAPVIRFDGFFDAWELRKLEEESDVRDGTHDSPKYFNDGYPLVTSKNLKDFGLDLSDVSLISDKDFKAINKRSKVDIGDILLGMIGTIGNPVQIDRADFAIKNVALIKEQKKILNSFLIQVLKSPVFNRYIRNENAGGTQKFLSLSKVRGFEFLCPNIEEQIRIGNFFKQIDNAITLHQCKIDALKRMKKGFLQQMFPTNEESVPRVRFADFENEWELRKLGEIATFSKGNGYTKNDLTEKGKPIVLYGRLYTKYETIINEVDTFVEMKDKSVVSQGNEVVVPASGETAEDISRASVIGTKGFILGGDLNIIKLNNEINSIFLALTISNGTQQKEMIKRAQGKSVVHLHNSDLKQLNLLYPNFEEQTKIGSFFKQLDDTITLNQQKLDRLKALKKAYLQNMFI
ncbi:restriction endonuclease subunit S [Enterococcus sp. DIV0125]|uniref:restriction endonuclease subunit S n=1 Tax=Enterococcus sp. DIV0125 TaxID=2774796 RepID=UPI003D2FC596